MLCSVAAFVFRLELLTVRECLVLFLLPTRFVFELFTDPEPVVVVFAAYCAPTVYLIGGGINALSNR